MADWREVLHHLADDVEDAFDDLKLRFTRWKGRDEPIQIVPYRGYAAADRGWLKARVLEKEFEAGDERDTLWQNLVRTYKRYESDEIPGARVRVSVGEESLELTADDEGYLDLELEHGMGDLPGEGFWRPVELELLGMEGKEAHATGRVAAPGDAHLAVISDLDDTVIKTGATNLMQMAQVIFLNNAKTRLPFSGVGAFYRALARGGPALARRQHEAPEGESTQDTDRPDSQAGEIEGQRNPIFYVSSSPWNLYDLFEDFMTHHGVPVGPIFLKEFGLTEDKFIKSGHSEHKLERIRTLTDAYPELPFILIGDSGQEDPEIYREVALERPERFDAVYIRDVTPDDRDAEVREIAEEVRDAGVPMFLVEDTLEAAKHAAEQGWIDESALGEIEDDRDRDEDEPNLLERLLAQVK